MVDENPKMVDVLDAFHRIEAQPVTLPFVRGHKRIPTGGHLQGIQYVYPNPPHPLTFIISASSHTVSYFVTIQFPPDISLDAPHKITPYRTPEHERVGIILKVHKICNAPLVHAGGIQIIGNCLVVGVEDNRARNQSKILFYDISNPAEPVLLNHLTLERFGEGMTAGAVGIVKRATDHLLVVSRWDAIVLDVYQSNGRPLIDPRCRFFETCSWVHQTAEKHHWKPDANWGKHQNINLFCDRSERIFLLAFNRNARGVNWLDLFSLELDLPLPGMLKKIENRRMNCQNKVNFRFGSGASILSPNRIIAYACAKKIQTFTNINVFRSAFVDTIVT